MCDIALEKPLPVEVGRAEAHIRLVTEGSEKKAIVENAEKLEVSLTEEQYQGLMKLAADWDEKVNKRGWSSGETKGHWWFAHQVTIEPDETKLTFAGKLLPREEIQEQYKKLIAECQEIVSPENKRSRLSEAYRDWAGYYLEAGDNEKALAILQEGLQTLGGDTQIQAMIEEVRSGLSPSHPTSTREMVGVPKISGRLDAPSTTWAGEIYVTGDVLVPAGATLTIEPGTIIKFAHRQDDANLFEEKEGEGYAYLTVTPLCSLIVEGTLIAEGTMTHPITFTSAAPSPEPGDWYGIIFRNSASGSEGDSHSPLGEGQGESGTGVVQHCQIEYAVRGISCYDTSPRILNNVIRNSALWGIFACGKNSNPVITENKIISTLFGIGAEGGSFSKCDAPAISDNVVRSARSAGIVATTDTSPLIKNNRVIESTEGIRCDWYATPKIKNNIIARNGTGILVIHASFPKIENNTIHGNRRFGIRIPDWEPEIKPKAGAPDAILIEQNILSENKDAAIHCDKNAPCKVTRNNLYQNNIFVNALTQMEGNLSVEPLFVDALNDDFRLSPESLCLATSIGAYSGVY